MQRVVTTAGPQTATLEDLDRQSVFHPFTAIQDHLDAGHLCVRLETDTSIFDQASQFSDEAVGNQMTILWEINAARDGWRYARLHLTHAGCIEHDRFTAVLPQ